MSSDVIRDTADIREKMLKLWKQLDDNKISATQVRLHIGLARAVLDTLKVEMAAAHLSTANIPAVPVSSGAVRLINPIRKPAN